jgi:4-amino-4-deoxy-L-arabinose transferase-like glycosyltransferase
MKLFLIVVLAILLRFWRLGEVPSGLHADETAFGYNAYSLFLTGKDEYGQFLPLTLRSFDDYKGAIYAYLIIPFIKFFGLSELTVRLPSAITGILLVLISYFLVAKLTKNKNLAILTTLLMTISPLPIFLSRVQSDPLVAVFLVILGFYFFILWSEKNKIGYLLINCFFGCLTNNDSSC